MKHVIIIIALFGVSTLQAQSLLNNWSVRGGVTWANPSVIRDNIAYQTIASTGFQFGIGKLLPITKGIGVELSGGLTQMNTYLEVPNRFNGYLISTYGFLETSLRGAKTVGKFTPFGSVGIRGGRLIQDNTDEVFFIAYKDQFDYGLSLAVGSEYALEKVNPFVAFGYYHGLLNIAPGNYTDGSGKLFQNEISNSVWSLQVGVRF